MDLFRFCIGSLGWLLGGTMYEDAGHMIQMYKIGEMALRLDYVLLG
jgi:hypothetical protein